MNIVITGTTSGLGRELATLFLEAGNAVVGISRSAQGAPVHEGYTHCVGDVARSDQVRAAALSCGWEEVDLIINNAGLPGSGRTIDEVEPREVQALLDVNLFGTLNVVQAFLPQLRKGRTKRVLNISSRFGSLTFNRRPENRRLKISYSYRLSKAAQNMLAVCLANELEGEGIAVDVIHPGAFQSPCGRPDATESPGRVASRIYHWIASGERSVDLKMFEIGGPEFDW